MKFSTAIIFSLGCFLVCNQAAANKVYKWTDSKGIVHFSEHPPLNTTTEVVKHPSPDNVPVDYGVPSSNASTSSVPKIVTTMPVSAAAQSSSTATQIPSFKDKERCEMARKNQESLKTFTHIKVKGDNGEYHYLTPEEQQQKLNEANLVVEQSCE